MRFHQRMKASGYYYENQVPPDLLSRRRSYYGSNLETLPTGHYLSYPFVQEKEIREKKPIDLVEKHRKRRDSTVGENIPRYAGKQCSERRGTLSYPRKRPYSYEEYNRMTAIHKNKLRKDGKTSQVKFTGRKCPECLHKFHQNEINKGRSSILVYRRGQPCWIPRKNILPDLFPQYSGRQCLQSSVEKKWDVGLVARFHNLCLSGSSSSEAQRLMKGQRTSVADSVPPYSGQLCLQCSVEKKLDMDASSGLVTRFHDLSLAAEPNAYPESGSEERKCLKHDNAEARQCRKHDNAEARQCLKHDNAGSTTMPEARQCLKHDNAEARQCQKHDNASTTMQEARQCGSTPIQEARQCKKHDNAEARQSKKHDNASTTMQEARQCKHDNAEARQCRSTRKFSINRLICCMKYTKFPLRSLLSLVF